jgi:hypothetical protein
MNKSCLKVECQTFSSVRSLSVTDGVCSKDGGRYRVNANEEKTTETLDKAMAAPAIQGGRATGICLFNMMELNGC